MEPSHTTPTRKATETTAVNSGHEVLLHELVALRHSEAALRDFIDTSTIGLHWVGADGTILWVNQAELDLLGYPREEYVGRNIAEFHADEPVINDMLGRLRRGETLRDYSARLRHRDGSIRHALVDSSVLFEDGKFVHTRCFTRDVTDSKQMEEALRKNEARLAKQAEELNRITHLMQPVACFARDLQDRIVYWNPGAADLYGFSKDEAIGQVSHVVLKTQFPAPLADILSQVRAAGRWNGELVHTHRDGHRLSVASHWALHKDPEGRPTAIMEVNLDITQRKQAEDNLREALRQLQLITDNMASGVTRCSRDLRYVWVSRSYAAWLGRTPEEIAGRSIIEVLGPEYYEVIRPRIEKVLSGERVEYEAPVNSPGIGTGWIHAVYVPTKDRSNKVDGWIAVVTDVSERHEAEERLRESEARLRNAERIAHAGNWHWDISVNHVTCSEGMWRILGGPQDYTPGFEGFFQTVIPQDRERVYQWGKDCLKAKRGNSIEFQIARSNRDLRTVSCTSEVLLNEDGLPVHLVGTCQDVTDQRRAEAASRQSRDEIAHLNRVGAMGELAGSLAHELNQPLAAILSNAQAANRFLSSEFPDLAQVRACLTDIVADDKRAREVIQRLRGLMKKEESRASVVDLNEVVNDALRLVGNDASLRQVSVKFEQLTDLPPVLGDRIQLYQVVLNLIVNGLDATAEQPPGDRWVLVRTAEDGSGVKLTVEDSGKGIAEGDLARVFEPFFTSKQEGLGMGLSISRTIVQAHGGRIWAERSAEHGAIFHCTLPVAQQAAVASGK